MKVILLNDSGEKAQKINLSVWHLVVFILLVMNTVFAFQYTLSSNSHSGTSRIFHTMHQGGISGVAVEPTNELLDDEESTLLKSIKFSEERLAFSQKNINSIEKLKGVQKPEKKKIKYRFLSPVDRGYISSNYGMRVDPINGKHRYHKGIDIAGVEGTEINTIASGFVTFVGRKGGYGNVVEIHHSNTLKSRYAHLNDTLVEKGTVVRKGEIVATMGSTGRVTGPHLHLEVWKNGTAKNPKDYLDLALGTKY